MTQRYYQRYATRFPMVFMMASAGGCRCTGQASAARGNDGHRKSQHVVSSKLDAAEIGCGVLGRTWHGA